MAIYFSPHKASGAGALGESIGKSLAGTLNMLTQRKMKQQERRQRQGEISEGLQSLYGMPAEAAQGIAAQPEKMQLKALEQFLGSEAFTKGNQQQQQQGQRQQLEQVLGQMSPEQQQQALQQPGVAELLGGGQQQQQPIGQGADEQFNSTIASIQKEVDKLSPEDREMLKKKMPELDRISRLSPEKQKVELSIPPGASREAKPAYRVQAKPSSQKTWQDLLRTPNASKADEKRAEYLLKERKQSFAEKKWEHDLSKDWRKDIRDKYDAAKEQDMNLGKMTTLNESDDLDDPSFATALKTLKDGVWGYGIDMSFLLSPESQNFQKLSMAFMKNLKSIFGSRITQREVGWFLQSIPTLMQTKEGRRRVIRDMLLLNKVPEIKNKALNEVVAMHGGVAPANIRQIVEKKIALQLEDLAQVFKQETKAGVDVRIGKLGEGKKLNPVKKSAGSLLKDQPTSVRGGVQVLKAMRYILNAANKFAPRGMPGRGIGLM